MDAKTFTQVRNEEKAIHTVLDGYKTRIDHDFWLADALQKDAIQNAWDARKDIRRGKEWRCFFSLKTLNNKKILCILDEGTKGLIGTRFKNRRELVEILLSNRENEDLAYFLNSNWSAKRGRAGGTRGRGKTIFLGASRNKKIVFDSLRSSDNSYVFGEIYLDVDKEVKFRLYWGEQAKTRLSEEGNGKLLPLEKHGTRILVLNPRASLEEAIKNGDFFIIY